jgi:ribosomal protein L11 methylase PrmA
VEKLTWQTKSTEWHTYYDMQSYSETALDHKKRLVEDMLKNIKPAPRMIWDLGANVGLFSRIPARQAILTIAFDLDAGAVEKNYLECRAHVEKNIIPLVLDLTNPSPGLGWSGGERPSIFERGPADTVFALALIHHMVIANNIPFDRIAQMFNQICSRALIIEFVPGDDSQVQRLLMNREDIFSDYGREKFEQAFGCYFIIQRKEQITDSKRILYLMIK